MKWTSSGVSITLIFCWVQPSAEAQLSVAGQLRTRTEYRNGVGTPRPQAYDAAFFTSQRTRLTFHYKGPRLLVQASLQDVRVWGQDASTISNADGQKLGVHEAWGELIVSNNKDTALKKSPVDYLAVRIGRQELVYDDSRLIGNLDWLQQGRRHDALVLKLLHGSWQVDLGAAFNQNTDAFNYNGTYYTPANVTPYVRDSKGNLAPTPAGLIPLTMASGLSAKTGAPLLQNAPGTNGLNQDYKAMNYGYIARTLQSVKLSGLFFTDHFGRYRIDSVRNISGTDTGYVYGRRFNKKGVHSRITTGLMAVGTLDKQKTFSYSAGAYFQRGKDRDGLPLEAFTSTASLGYTKNSWTFTAGWDYLSGNNAFSASATNHRFDPLYGTPHKFWGYMDYFYAGTGSPAGGLSNPFLRAKYTSRSKLFTATLDAHSFSLAQDQKDASGSAFKKHLGNELDLVANYALNKAVSLEWGASLLRATNSMEYAKGAVAGTTQRVNSWSYLMLNFRPEFHSK